MKEIGELVLNFLSGLGVIDKIFAQTYNSIFNLNNLDYKDIKKKYNLNDERDIVWMKFTKEGCLGVVACSNDINFDIPKNAKQYDEKDIYDKRKWKYNTSGIIIHQLKQEWNENFVLLFPLEKIPKDYNRLHIEWAVGNYLIENKIPILDLYSHQMNKFSKEEINKNI
ncbi:hypothetical protein [Gemella sp. zg-1178]|uniref:hypothetical protein n=1 Tax=Gemella sp. zg-1178 TaxID=2840372 RepID=UPI001C045A51|nr:hypothetical protein [Gemella sp. zg-1178]MBU0278827.1 hypothetical protein [Gemella sp. zg-1178]